MQVAVVAAAVLMEALVVLLSTQLKVVAGEDSCRATNDTLPSRVVLRPELVGK